MGHQIPTMHTDPALFRTMTTWAKAQPECDWHPIERLRHNVISSDVPPYGVPVFVRYRDGVGTGSLVVDAFGATWLGIGIGATAEDIHYPDAWMPIPD